MLAGLRQYHTFSVMEAKNGDLWFGTIGAGAYHYDPSASLRTGGKSLALGKPYGAPIILESSPGGQVFGIVEDNAGNIWFGREGGVYRYDPAAAKTGANPITKF